MGGMRRRTAPEALTALTTGALTVALLTACSGGADEPDDEAGSSPTSAETSAPPPGEDGAGATAYLDVPEGVTLTGQGAVLELGEQATVAWEPRADVVGALDVAVTEVVEAPMSVFRGWRLDPAARSSAAYFVTAEVTNVGEEDLSGVPVPLYAVDASMVLVQPSSFEGRFRPCPSGAFPAGFTPGASAEVCQVYLLADEGDLGGTAFRPTEDFVPITWDGPVGEYDDPADRDARDDRDDRGDRRGGDVRDRERDGGDVEQR